MAQKNTAAHARENGAKCAFTSAFFDYLIVRVS